MAEITVNDEQARTILSNSELISVKDRMGNVIAYISPPVVKENVEDIERRLARRESESKGHTFEEVLDHLRELGQDQLNGRSNASRRLLDGENSPSPKTDEPQ